MNEEMIEQIENVLDLIDDIDGCASDNVEAEIEAARACLQKAIDMLN